MNRHGEKERWTSVPILCQITLQNVPYKDYKLLVLMSFEVTTVNSMDSWDLTCCDDGHLLASEQIRCEHAAYLIRCILEALNSKEDGTNVWQLDAPSQRSQPPAPAKIETHNGYCCIN